MLVAGEPGIGKTALLGALADDAADRSVLVAWGQCWDDSMAPPFWPWTQVLRELGHVTNPLSDARLPATADPALSDGTVDRFALFDAVGTLLIGVAEAHGLVVVLDDLQWADEATLALLSFLCFVVGALACLVGLLVAYPVVSIAAAYTYRRLQDQPVAP